MFGRTKRTRGTKKIKSEARKVLKNVFNACCYELAAIAKHHLGPAPEQLHHRCSSARCSTTGDGKGNQCGSAWVSVDKLLGKKRHKLHLSSNDSCLNFKGLSLTSISLDLLFTHRSWKASAVCLCVCLVVRKYYKLNERYPDLLARKH